MGWDYERFGEPDHDDVPNICANCKHFRLTCASVLFDEVENKDDVIEALHIADDDVGLCIPLNRNGKFYNDDIRVVDATSSRPDEENGCFQYNPYGLRYFPKEVER